MYIMHFHEIFVVSSTESVLIYKSYRVDFDTKSKDRFLQVLREKGHSLSPHFNIDKTYYYNIKRGGLLFVATSKHENSPIMVLESLSRLYSILKDFCGTVNEDSLQVNNLMVLEILNEFADFGYIQTASTDKLQPYIQSNPILMRQIREPTTDITSRVFGIETKTSPGSTVVRSVVSPMVSQEAKKNELFIDIIERLTAVIDSNGKSSTLEVSGSMIMKNFISGSPQIFVTLNDDLSILDRKNKAYGDHVQLDKCNFHQCVKFEEIESSRLMTVVPPSGEFSAMTYSSSGEIALNIPFKLLAFAKDAENSRDKVVTLRLRNELPSNFNAVKVNIQINIPHCIERMSQQLTEPEQSAELNVTQHKIIWKIKRFPGRAEYIANFRLIHATGTPIKNEDIGPVRMDFEISGYTCSGLQIKTLKISEIGKKSNVKKWIRLITVSDSYVIKLWS